MIDTPQPASVFPSVGVRYDEIAYATFHKVALDRGFVTIRHDEYPSDTGIGFTIAGSETILDSGTRRGRSFVAVVMTEAGPGLVLVTASTHAVTMFGAAATVAAVDAVMDVLHKTFAVHTPPEDLSSVDVRFWTTGSSGPRSVTRSIAAPTFEEVRGNYATEARHVLDKMVDRKAFVPGAGGQLILWYGPPGTGKTFALRALAQAWRDWCDIDYVVDPEQFFGDATYLMPVLLSERPSVYDPSTNTVRDNDDRWRLLIFEDTGELLSADARTRAGQGLSRLLNVVDGFIGQGLKTLILITTNEELDRLHPAVSRPGRCALKAHFGPLSAAESDGWARRNGVLVPRGEHTLAELFAAREGFINGESTASKPIGFRAPETALPIRVSPLREEAS